MLSQFIMPVLAKILDKDKNDFKTQVLKKSLESFPEKMLVRKNNQILFSNKDSSAEDSNLLIFPIDEDNTNLELSNFSKDQISTEFYHTQRISLLGELLNTLQHELSNPLFGLNLTSTLLESEAQSEETAELLKEISQNANRSQTIIKNFSNLYTTQENHKQLALFSFLEEVATLTKSETKEIKKTIIWKGFADEVEARQFQITTNSTYLTQIIFN
jgi:nitrogen-specific signal transduction histidine kinase